MNEPRRLSQSGGVSQRLLDSASIDKPSAAARRRAALLAATVSSFSTTSSHSSSAPVPRVSVAKTLATWIVIGAAASVTLALLGSKLVDSSRDAGSPRAAAPALAELPSAPSPAPGPSPDIVAEPKHSVAAPSIAATPAEPPAPAEEARELERIQALGRTGKAAEARKLASEFRRKYPESPLLNQLHGLGQ